MRAVRSLRSGIALLTTVGLMTLALNAVAQTEVRYAELPNFHLVNSQLYRGAQPKAGGLKRLKAIGVKTIVNLRGADEHTQEEEQEARTLGLRFYNVALPEFSKPKDQDVQRALDLINAPENQPVFVHCRRGADRTGTVIASYRISHDGWTGLEAKKEAEKHGLSWTQLGMKHYIDEFYKKHRRANTSVIQRP
ncbi:MAG TPA: tyrosine-protein phosphatase [Pyrinomonadaceae bacterium]|nr:tyrosine-protein phosphatase [Pyrinomonadaceae bacterium]